MNCSLEGFSLTEFRGKPSYVVCPLVILLIIVALFETKPIPYPAALLNTGFYEYG
jgi:hypothetical protein